MIHSTHTSFIAATDILVLMVDGIGLRLDL